MPKIKVYKDNGNMIPVDSAKVGIGFQCPWTDRLFRTKHSYIKHLRDLRSMRHDRVRARTANNNRSLQFEELINQPSFDDIIQWVNHHPKFFYEQAVRSGSCHFWSPEEIKNKSETFWMNITYLSLNWDSNASNTHSCPRNGVTNWDGDKSKPKGYPGWRGKIEFKISDNVSFGSNIFHGLGLNTGSGGGIAVKRYGYEVTLFASDWPGLEKHSLFQILKGERPLSYVYGTKNYFR